MKRIWDGLQRYHQELTAWGCTWYSSWQGYTEVRFNRYREDTNMKLHCDHIHSMFDGQRKGVPTLTVLGGLNNGYEGGDLVFWQDTPITLKSGEIMIFPSNFLYPHRVDMVTKGTRYSYVSWTW
jgi:predicted 2-oxoglutarate/Fe(II)-dependent dioxygenase YbiX